MYLYPITEHFYSLQGEGAHSGQAAYFIRLAGCLLACPFCDSKNAWSPYNKPKLSAQELCLIVKESGAPNVVITGGEPLSHPLDELCTTLKKAGLQVWLETSGVGQISGDFNWICLSPKSHAEPNPQIYALCNELKVVISQNSDFEFAQQQAQKVNPQTLLYLQSDWYQKENIQATVIQYIQAHPQWRLSLQTHKYLDIL